MHKNKCQFGRIVNKLEILQFEVMLGNGKI